MRLYGKKPVLERIKSDPGSIRKLYLQKKTDMSEIVKASKEAGITFDSVEKEVLVSMSDNANTQGVMAEVDEFEYASFDEVLSECLDSKTVPVFLDGVTDPQNLGSVIRNLACMGGFSVILSEHRSVQVTETVLRVACGGENYVKIAKVMNQTTTISAIKEKGIFVAGAVVEDSEDIAKTEFKYPLAVVIGSEGKGIRPGIQKHLDIKVSLPMAGAALSYNAAVATALLCYEISRRRV
ncbi:MAG: 23S rRNA (guanosine(2251)-2'-O)-methyltransferase RlmB [Candidatus Tantalella remota]|nr:23S rRNA (guanosine(2251)-2'-O)-methyltransferase RlmB [Candidatus Tantalella remota]